VLDTHQIEDGGVQVMDLDGIFDGVVPKLVRLADRDAGLDPATREPDAEGPG